MRQRGFLVKATRFCSEAAALPIPPRGLYEHQAVLSAASAIRIAEAGSNQRRLMSFGFGSAI